MRIATALLAITVLAPNLAMADYSHHPKAAQLAKELQASGLYNREEVLAILRKTN